MIDAPKPLHCDAATLHAQIDGLRLGSYTIEWQTDVLTLRFDRELTTLETTLVEDVVRTHDGSMAIAERAEREAKIQAIQDANKALVESAREKRLRGEQMTQPELAALVDLLMFPV